MKAVYVEWWDTIKLADWTPSKDVEHIFKTPTKTIGWLIKKSDQAITIALSYDQETDMFSCFKTIPMVAVKKIKNVSVQSR